jgi:hypothetical protein
MDVARVDHGDEDRASTGACAHELSTCTGEKGVHERGNGCGSGGFGSLPAENTENRARRGATTARSHIGEVFTCGAKAREARCPAGDEEGTA